MNVPSATRILKAYWVVVVVILALLAATAVVARLRTFFDSDRPLSPDTGHAALIEPFNVKTITYEIVGPPDAAGHVSYLNPAGQTVEAAFTELPWSATVSTTDPGVLANVVAQGDTDTLSCRILVNGKVVDEQRGTGTGAQVFCLDKAA